MVAGLLWCTLITGVVVEGRLGEPLVDESNRVDVAACGRAEAKGQVLTNSFRERGGRVGVSVLVCSPDALLAVLLRESC